MNWESCMHTPSECDIKCALKRIQPTHYPPLHATPRHSTPLPLPLIELDANLKAIKQSPGKAGLWKRWKRGKEVKKRWNGGPHNAYLMHFPASILLDFLWFFGQQVTERGLNVMTRNWNALVSQKRERARGDIMEIEANEKCKKPALPAGL